MHECYFISGHSTPFTHEEEGERNEECGQHHQGSMKPGKGSDDRECYSQSLSDPYPCAEDQVDKRMLTATDP